MAQGIFNQICKNRGIAAVADSAGIYADGSPASENAVLAMKELGIDIDGRKSKSVTCDMIKSADFVLTMSASHKKALMMDFGNSEKIKTLSEFVGEGGDVPDPFGGSIDMYRHCRDSLKTLIEKAVEKL